MSAPVVVIGPGAVGCGVIAADLQRSGEPYLLVGRAGAPEPQSLEVHSGRARISLTPQGYLALDDPAFSDAVGAAPAVVVAVGSGAGPDVAPPLAAALARRGSPVNVLVCDNRPVAARALRSLVQEHDLGGAAGHGFAGVLVDRIVNRSTGTDGARRMLAEPGGGLYVDGRELVAPLPEGPHWVPVERFGAHLVRKLFIFSAGHAAAAYLGGVSGHDTLTEALADPAIRNLVRASMREGQRGIAAALGGTFAGDEAHVELQLTRFATPGLADPVARVGRDPLRKLGQAERICGPARLVRAAGGDARALAVVGAAALWWGSRHCEDLSVRLAEHGPRALVAKLAGLEPHDRLVDDITRAHEVLASGGGFAEAGARLAAVRRVGR